MKPSLPKLDQQLYTIKEIPAVIESRDHGVAHLIG